MTKKEMIEDYKRFGTEKIKTLDESVHEAVKFSLSLLLGMQLIELGKIDGRKKEQLKSCFERSKTLFLKTYEDAIAKWDESLE